MRHFNSLRYFPFLKGIIGNFAFKMLNFTDFPYYKSAQNRLNRQLSLMNQERIFSDEMSKWYSFLADVLFKSELILQDVLRVGSEADGGYLLPASFSSNSNWVTIGLGYNCDFENALARNNNRVTTFDHTVPKRLRNLDKSVIWKKIGWGEKGVSKELENLETLVKMVGFQDSEWCLKFDIEGNEWPVLNQITSLSKMPTILLSELHHLLWVNNENTQSLIASSLRELSKHYDVFYYHGNNFSAYHSLGDFALYDCIEVGWILKGFDSDLLSRPTNYEQYPNKFLEVPNDPKQIQYFCGVYDFPNLRNS